MDSIKKYWAELQPRERLILGFGAVIVAMILSYAVLQRFYIALAHMEGVLPSLRSNLVWMRQTDQLLERGGNISIESSTEGVNESLLSVVESTARRANIRKSIQQMVPTRESNEVRVVLEDADFNQWLRWVDTLYKRNGVDIRQVSAERDEDQPNIAEIRVTFYRP